MILLERRGKLVGLVTVKDVLKYMAHVENSEMTSSGDNTRDSGEFIGRLFNRLFQRTTRTDYMRLRNSSDESHEMHTPY